MGGMGEKIHIYFPCCLMRVAIPKKKFYFLSACIFLNKLSNESQCRRIGVEDMLKANALKFRGNWDKQMPLMEFIYNSSYQSSIEMAPFKALYGRKCRTLICWE